MKRSYLGTVLGVAILSFSMCLFSNETAKEASKETNETEWMNNFNDAKAAAEKENKQILVNFTGSDWCPWCVKLDEEVFNTTIFREYAKENLVLFIADFTKKKKLLPEVEKQNNELMEKYNIEGFPAVLLLDKNGNTLLETGYKEGGPEKYVDTLKEAIEKNKTKKELKN